jgi:hypothetical protein
MKKRAMASLLLVVAALSGCSSSTGPTPLSPSATPQSTLHATGKIDPSALKLSYHVEGGGSFVNGSRDLCDLLTADSIIIEDEKAVAHYDGSQPFTSMALGRGQIEYSTAWPDDVVGTGVTDGSGSYVVNADSSGKPTSITGHATVIYHDKATGSNAKKSDDVTFTLTQIARPDYCQPAS